MLVKDRMTLNPTGVSPELSVSEAFALMRERKVHRLPVLKNGKLVGIVTEKQLQRVTPSEATTLSVFEINYLLSKMTVADAMTKDVLTIEDSALIESAAVLMRDHNIGTLPVMRNGKLVGILTESDILDAFVDMLGASNSGARLVVRMRDEPGAAQDVFSIISKYEVNIQHMALSHGRNGAEITFRLDTADSASIKRAIVAKGYEVVEEEL